MQNSNYVPVTNCPLKIEVCFPECNFWTKNGCRRDELLKKSLEDRRAMLESSRLHRSSNK